MDHLAAGIDTTGDALCFLMYHLSLPENLGFQEKLINSLSKSKIGSSEELEGENSYLDAVIKESLRCFPPIPMSQPRYVPSGGRVINGYYVKEGTIVSCQAWSVHQWCEDVFPGGNKFNPDRWLDRDKGRILDMNRCFFAFGAGGRGCTGRQ